MTIIETIATALVVSIAVLVGVIVILPIMALDGIEKSEDQ